MAVPAPAVPPLPSRDRRPTPPSTNPFADAVGVVSFRVAARRAMPGLIRDALWLALMFAVIATIGVFVAGRVFLPVALIAYPLVWLLDVAFALNDLRPKNQR